MKHLTTLPLIALMLTSFDAHSTTNIYLNKRAIALEQDFNKQKNEIERLSKKIASTENTVNRLNSNIDKIANKSDLSSEIAKLKQHLQKLDKEIKQFAEFIGKRHADLINRYHAIEANHQKHAENINEHATAIRSIKNDIDLFYNDSNELTDYMIEQEEVDKQEAVRMNNAIQNIAKRLSAVENSAPDEKSFRAKLSKLRQRKNLLKEQYEQLNSLIIELEKKTSKP